MCPLCVKRSIFRTLAPGRRHCCPADGAISLTPKTRDAVFVTPSAQSNNPGLGGGYCRLAGTDVLEKHPGTVRVLGKCRRAEELLQAHAQERLGE